MEDRKLKKNLPPKSKISYDVTSGLFFSELKEILNSDNVNKVVKFNLKTMRFNETKFPGAFIVEIEPHKDERGFFARSFCQKEFAQHGLKTEIVQSNIAYNKTKGTLRGMHYQTPPHAEAKLVRCTKGALYDIIIDIREESATYCQWEAFELTEINNLMLYIPEGFAHGFQTLKDDTTVFYQMFGWFHPESARGIRWNDPTFKIEWPLPVSVISEKDKSYEDFFPYLSV